MQIRTEIEAQVARRCQRTDEQIIDYIVSRYNGEELLVPTATGIDALAWALPATAFVVRRRRAGGRVPAMEQAGAAGSAPRPTPTTRSSTAALGTSDRR